MRITSRQLSLFLVLISCITLQARAEGIVCAPQWWPEIGGDCAPVDPTDTGMEPADGTPLWYARELRNYLMSSDSIGRQTSDPAFMQAWMDRSTANRAEYNARPQNDPHWDSSQNVCATWGLQCAGDPYRYPDYDGPNDDFGTAFYDTVADVTPVNFLDAGGARLSGRVWAPKSAFAAGSCPGPNDADAGITGKYPGVVLINGSVQAPETLYWWAAQLLVKNCYVVLTFDPRGQGRSDSTTPGGEQGSNANAKIFETNLVDAIDFFYSAPGNPYHANTANTGNPTPQDKLTAYNPAHDRIDRERFGIIGHSLGARGVSTVQGLGADGAAAWYGRNVASNPVDVAVAWDNLQGPTATPDPFTQLAGNFGEGAPEGPGPVVPRVPAMGQSADYFLAPAPYASQPDANEKTTAFEDWKRAGIETMQINIRGGTHYEWSLLPTFPTSDWVAGGDDSADPDNGWGNPLAQHFTLAWLDLWLKRDGETGAGSALARLTDNEPWRDRYSFYFRSARYFGENNELNCEDMLRKGC